MTNDHGEPHSSNAIVSERDSARGGVANAAAALGGTALAFGLVAVVGWGWGSRGTGVFFGAVSLFVIVSTAMKLGMETALVQQLARARADADHRAVRVLLVEATVPVLLASMASALVLWIFADQFGDWFTSDRDAAEFAAVLRVLAPFVPAWSLSLTLLGATRGVGTMTPTALGLQLLQPGLQIAGVIVVALADAALRWVALGWGAPLIVTLVVAAWSMRPHVLESAGIARVDAATRSQLRGQLWSFAGPRGIAGTLQTALDRVGVLLVGGLAGAAVAGQWVVVTRLVSIANRVFHAIGQGLNARLSALAQRGEWPELSSIVQRVTQITIAVLVVPLLALGVFPRAALSTLFGDEFGDGARGLQVAVAVTVAAVIWAHADNVLLMAGKASVAMRNTAAALIASIIGYVVLVPPFELVGAALALGIGVVVYRAAAAWEIQRRFGVDAAGAASLRTIGIAAVVAGLPLVIVRLVGGDVLVAALIGGAIAALAWLAVWLGPTSTLPHPKDLLA